MSSYRLGIDIGGTFTDFVLVNEQTESLRFGKTLTTHGDPTEAIITGMNQLLEQEGIQASDVAHVVHGTTLVTNAVIERKGAKTALLTTAGFEDVLEIGREMRYDIYDLFMTVPEPLVPRHLRFGIQERIDAAGQVIHPLAVESVLEAMDQAIRNGIKAVAICYLHAFTNPNHERQTRQLIRDHHPQLSISISSEVMPEIREYERCSATTMNAYVQPITQTYLRRLDQRLRSSGFEGELHIMLSSGRLTTLEGAVATPIHLLESGPAGGCMASVFFGDQLNSSTLFTFDMGGTTAKASLIHNGKPDITNQFEAGRVRRFRKGSGLPVRIPVIDMIEIGAGGGSIAGLDALGLLKVGPKSAGSEPGPACYGRKGCLPTVTDADLVLGYLNPEYFLGGSMTLDREAAEQAIRTHVAEPLGLSVIEAAQGIHRIVNENMAGAARVHILEKGKDPRRYCMLAFGGAGPVHAFGVARLMGIQQLVIPVGAGVASALGFLVSPIATGLTRSYLKRLSESDWQEVHQFLTELEQQGRRFLDQSGVPADQVKCERFAEMRYAGQGHELTVALPSESLIENPEITLAEAFIDAYRSRYQRVMEGHAIETVTYRVVVRGPAPVFAARPDQNLHQATALKTTRQVYFSGEIEPSLVPVYDRYGLQSGERIEGPLIVEERESTFVIGRQAHLDVDANHNMVVTLRSDP